MFSNGKSVLSSEEDQVPSLLTTLSSLGDLRKAALTLSAPLPQPPLFSHFRDNKTLQPTN